MTLSVQDTQEVRSLLIKAIKDTGKLVNPSVSEKLMSLNIINTQITANDKVTKLNGEVIELGKEYKRANVENRNVIAQQLVDVASERQDLQLKLIEQARQQATDHTQALIALQKRWEKAQGNATKGYKQLVG